MAVAWGYAVCDSVALAADGARFGLTETRLGLIPATIGPYVVARLGEAMARRVFMSARIVDARRGCSARASWRRVVASGRSMQQWRPRSLPYLAAAPAALSCRQGAGAAARAADRRRGDRGNDRAGWPTPGRRQRRARASRPSWRSGRRLGWEVEVRVAAAAATAVSIAPIARTQYSKPDTYDIVTQTFPHLARRDLGGFPPDRQWASASAFPPSG